MVNVYNAVFKTQSPTVDVVMKMLALKKEHVFRFRDAWLSDDGLVITVQTKTGGQLMHLIPNFEAKMAGLPGFISAMDDTLNDRYRYFSYKVPEEYVELTKIVARYATRGNIRESQFTFVDGHLEAMAGVDWKRIVDAAPDELSDEMFSLLTSFQTSMAMLMKKIDEAGSNVSV